MWESEWQQAQIPEKLWPQEYHLNVANRWHWIKPGYRRAQMSKEASRQNQITTQLRDSREIAKQITRQPIQLAITIPQESKIEINQIMNVRIRESQRGWGCSLFSAHYGSGLESEANSNLEPEQTGGGKRGIDWQRANTEQQLANNLSSALRQLSSPSAAPALGTPIDTSIGHCGQRLWVAGKIPTGAVIGC